MAKMFPPEGSSGLSDQKPNRDGSYDIAEHRVPEMRNVHGFRLATDPKPLSADEMDEQTALRLRAAAASNERIAVLEAENQTLTTANARLVRERDALAAQLRARDKK